VSNLLECTVDLMTDHAHNDFELLAFFDNLFEEGRVFSLLLTLFSIFFLTFSSRYFSGNRCDPSHLGDEKDKKKQKGE
jgi:hypothetical protein